MVFALHKNLTLRLEVSHLYLLLVGWQERRLELLKEVKVGVSRWMKILNFRAFQKFYIYVRLRATTSLMEGRPGVEGRRDVDNI